jgi:hypothetical protein
MVTFWGVVLRKDLQGNIEQQGGSNRLQMEGAGAKRFVPATNHQTEDDDDADDDDE